MADDELSIDDFVIIQSNVPAPPSSGIFAYILSWWPFWSTPDLPPPEEFTSASELRAYVRGIIADYGECRSVRDKSKVVFTFLLQLYSYHPAKPDGIIDFAIVRGSYGNMHLSIIKQNTSHPLSWVKCLENIPKFASNRKPNPAAEKRKQLASAMRTAVAYQINKIKVMENGVFTCVLCSTKSSKSSDMHVDHVVPFCKLMDDFLTKWDPHSIPSRFEYNRGRIQISVMDRPFEIAWAEFHQQNAKLQLLCKTCNLRKGKKM